MKKINLLLLALTALLLFTTHALADTMIAGYTFHDNAFADKLLAFSGTWRWYPGDGTKNIVGTDALLEAQLVGANIDTHAFCITGSKCDLDIAFTDNAIVNGGGADLAVFELGGPDVVRIVIGGISGDYQTSWTGYNYNGGPIGHLNQINVALINLDDFGISALGSVSTLRAQSLRTDGHSPTYTVFGALTSGPPITAAHVGIGGRLLTAYGQPVSITRVTLSDMNGASRSALSSSLGYYRFDDVEVGQTYMLSVKTRRFRFQPVVVSVFDELTELNLIAEP